MSAAEEGLFVIVARVEIISQIVINRLRILCTLRNTVSLKFLEVGIIGLALLSRERNTFKVVLGFKGRIVEVGSTRADYVGGFKEISLDRRKL